MRRNLKLFLLFALILIALWQFFMFTGRIDDRLPPLETGKIKLGRLALSSFGIVDDAWITYTYARNLAAGEGIVFNAGERVEGCTAFLHMALLAPFARLTSRLDLVAVLLNILAWAGLTLIAWTFIRRRDGGAVGMTGRFAIGFILIGNTALAWTFSGMEMPLVALAWLAAAKMHLIEREKGSWPWASALLVVAAGLLRPDGILVAVPLAISTWIAGPRKFAWGKAIVFCALVLGLFGGYWLWRWSYFGYPLPNTFYAKVTKTSLTLTKTGMRYLFRWFFGMVVPLLGAIAFYIARKTRPAPRWVKLMAGMIATSAAYVLLVGADFFPYHRFLLPAFAPMVLVAWWYGVGVTINRRRTAPSDEAPDPYVMKLFKATLVFVLVQTVYYIAFFPPQGSVHAYIVQNTRDWKKVGALLNETLPPDAMVATLPIGAMGYCTHRYVLDLVGLTDTHIAHTDVPTGEALTGHEKYDIDYVLERAPEVIYAWPGLMPAGPVGIEKWVSNNIGAAAQKHLMTDRRTRIRYRLSWLPVGERGVIGLLRRDLDDNPAYASFDKLTDQQAEWIWHAFTAQNLQELAGRFIELRKGNYSIGEPPGASMDQGVALPFSFHEQNEK